MFTTNLSNKKKTDFQNCLNIIKKRKPDALWTVSKIDKKFNPIKQLIFKGSKLKYFSKDGATFKSRQLLKIPTLEMELFTSIQEQQFLKKKKFYQIIVFIMK